MALRLASSSAHRDLIAGVIGISPVLDWASTIRLAVRGARLPGLIAALALRALQAPGTSALLGAPEPMAFSDLAWTTTAVPTLLLHSAGDRTASYADSVAFHDRNSGLVTLPELAPSPHALEWNADPERFARPRLRLDRPTRRPCVDGATESARASVKGRTPLLG